MILAEALLVGADPFAWWDQRFCTEVRGGRPGHDLDLQASAILAAVVTSAASVGLLFDSPQHLLLLSAGAYRSDLPVPMTSAGCRTNPLSAALCAGNTGQPPRGGALVVSTIMHS